MIPIRFANDDKTKSVPRPPRTASRPRDVRFGCLLALLVSSACSSSHEPDSGDVPYVEAGADPADAGVPEEAGLDAGTPTIDVVVTVVDGLARPVAGALWVVINDRGARQEGATLSDGTIRAELDANLGPFALTVAAEGVGARSIVGIHAPLLAELQLGSELSVDFSYRDVQITRRGQAADEWAVAGGAGFTFANWFSNGTTTSRFAEDQPQYGLMVFGFRPQTVRYDGWDFDTPFGRYGSHVPVRAIEAVPASPRAFGAEIEVDMSGGETALVELPAEITLPTEGRHQPRVLFAEAHAVRREGAEPFGVQIPIGSARLTPNADRTALAGALVLFEDPSLRPDRVDFSLRNGSGRQIAVVRTTLDRVHVDVPPVDGPVSISGETVDTVTFASGASRWTHVRFGLEQAREPATVSWIVVSRGGALPETGLPELPDGADLAWIGFEEGTPVEAWVEVHHELEPETTVRDVPVRPYVEGVGTLPDTRSPHPRLTHSVSL